MSVTDSISIVAVCGECAMAFRRDPQLGASGLPLDYMACWEEVQRELARHRTVAHPPDSWEQLATDMLRRLGDGRVPGGPSFRSRFVALCEASR